MLALKLGGLLLVFVIVAAWGDPRSSDPARDVDGAGEALKADNTFPNAELVASLYAITSSDAEEACCSGGATGGADPTGNECTKVELVAAEFVNGRRVVSSEVSNHLAPTSAANSVALRPAVIVTR